MNGTEHDRFLQEALRHAPDADAAPPPSLSESILREARAAVAPAAPTWRDRAAAFWQSLASPRLAGALASLMVLTLAGVMWWDRPIEEAMPARGAPLAAAPSPVAVAPAAPPAVVAEPTAAAPAPAAPEAALAKAAPPDMAMKAERRRMESHEQARAAAKEPSGAITPAPTPTPAPGLRAEPPAADAPRADATRDAAGPAAAVAPAPAAPPAAAMASPGLAEAQNAAAAKQAARSTASASGFVAGASAPGRPMIAAGATTWDSGDGRARAVDGEFAAFLAQVEAAAGRTGFASSLAPSTERAEARPAAATLNLQREGLPLRTLRIDGDVLTIVTPDGASRRVPLAPGSGAALAARLAELSR